MRIIYTFIFVAFAVLIAPFSLAADGRHGVLRYDVNVRGIPDDARVIDVWLPVPPCTDEQEILSLEILAEVKGELLREPLYDNRVWHGRFVRPADGELAITEVVEFLRNEQVGLGDNKAFLQRTSGNPSRFLRPNYLVPLTDRFKQIAGRAIGSRSTSIDPARALYEHVLQRMTYDKSGSRWGRGDANYACDIGKGNCSDFHSLFIALSRSAEIPARFWIGFPLPSSRGRQEIQGYHCWAEFYMEGVGWVPVDISEADKHPNRASYFFGHVDENRIAFSLGRDLVLPPSQQGPPLNFFVYPYVEVDGKPWTKVERTITFEDGPAPLKRRTHDD